VKKVTAAVFFHQSPIESSPLPKVGGYSIVEGDSKEAIVELLRTHPHLKRAGASIDLLEMITMPGL
jgi:hypothetical protein